MPLHPCILLWVNLPDASVCICLGSLIMWPSHSFEHLIVNSSKHITCILLRTCLLPVMYFSYNWAHVCYLWCVFHVTEHMSVACDVFFIELSTCLFANDAYTCLLVVFLLLHFTFSIAMAWYVVHRRKEPGVYSSWDKAHAQVDGFQG